MDLRRSNDFDGEAIASIHASAFGPVEGPEIVQLVGGLFGDATAKPVLSLVAEIDGALVGHVLFTVVTLQPDTTSISARILAPLAVSPHYQRRGIGSALVNEGITQLTESGVALLFVLGDPTYYSQFGFRPAGAMGLSAPHAIPKKYADAWMAQFLGANTLGSVTGKVQCSDILSDPKHWLEADSE